MGTKRQFILLPPRAISLRHTAKGNLPRSIDTSVHAGKLSRPQSFALWKVLLSVEQSTRPFCGNLPLAEEKGNGRRDVITLSCLLPLGCLDKYTDVYYWGWRSVSKRLKVRIYILLAIYGALERFTRQFFSLRNLTEASTSVYLLDFLALSDALREEEKNEKFSRVAVFQLYKDKSIYVKNKKIHVTYLPRTK